MNIFKLLASNATTVNVILAFLIANFVTLATVIGLLNFYNQDADKNSQTVDRLIQQHLQQDIGVTNRQNEILINQHTILSAEQKEGAALQNLTAAMAEHVRQGQQGVGGSTNLDELGGKSTS